MTTSDFLKIFAGLADVSRLRLLKALTEGPATVNTLAERLGLTQYNASRHLTALRHAGIVEVEARGTSRIQSIAKEHSVTADGSLDLGIGVLHLGQLKVKKNGR